MLEKLRDIWILSKDGIVIFKHVNDEKVDSQLFGGYMSAINTFAKELDEAGMSGFEMGQTRIMIRKENPLLFVANCNKNIKAKVAEKELDSIVKEFYNIYPKQDLNSWNGDVSKFETFDKEFEKKQNIALEKLKDGLWY